MWVRETAELLTKLTKFGDFDGKRKGLSAREWAALRFLSRANRLSRRPMPLAAFLGITCATSTQIVKALEAKSYVVRVPYPEDRRSVVLNVTARGKTHLVQHDPMLPVLSAIATLKSEDGTRLHDFVTAIINVIDASQAGLKVGTCKDCMFLAGGPLSMSKSESPSGRSCRLYRIALRAEEIELECSSFQPARHGTKKNASSIGLRSSRTVGDLESGAL